MIFHSDRKPCFPIYLLLTLASQIYSFLCRVTEISFFKVTSYFCQWRFQHSSSCCRAACESELPTGSLLPTGLLKDLHSQEKPPDAEVVFQVSVTQPPTGRLLGSLAAQHQGAKASNLEIQWQAAHSKMLLSLPGCRTI